MRTMLALIVLVPVLGGCQSAAETPKADSVAAWTKRQEVAKAKSEAEQAGLRRATDQLMNQKPMGPSGEEMEADNARREQSHLRAGQSETEARLDALERRARLDQR